MRSTEFHGRSIFVDANAFIYYLEGTCSDFTAELIEAGSKELSKLKLVTTSRVVDEVLFKIAIIRAKMLDPYFRSRTVDKLRKRPDMVKVLAGSARKVIQFFRALNLEILPVSESMVFQSVDFMERYGIFGNDAISVCAMQKRNMKYILSSDGDFDLVDWIERIDPLS